MSENIVQNEQLQQLSPEASSLPPELVEVCGEGAVRLSGFGEVIRHIGHSLVETDIPVTASAAEACGGVVPSNALYVLSRLERLGLLEVYTPDNPGRPVSGRWLAASMRFFRPTELGSSVLPESDPQACGMRNPFARLTPLEREVSSCVSCHLKLLGSFTAKQVSDCAKLREDAAVHPNNVMNILRDFCQAGVLARATDASPRPLFGGQHPTPFSYSLTDEGAGYLAPVVAEDCPSRAQITSSKESSLLAGLNPAQREVIDIIAGMYGALVTGRSTELIRQATIRNMGKTQQIVDNIFQKLVKAGYLEKQTLPGRTKTDHYAPTAAGAELFMELYYISEADQKREDILNICAPHVINSADLPILIAGLKSLSARATVLFYERLQRIGRQRAITSRDVKSLIDACKKILLA